MKRFSSVWTLVFLIVAGASGLAGATPPDQPLELASRIHPSQASGTGAGASSQYILPSISADGRYAVFGSRATNLVPGQRDVNHLDVSSLEDRSGTDVFLQDLVTGTTTLVSHSLSSPTATGNLPSEDAVISRGGRYVALTSRATDLAPGQTVGLGSDRDEDLLLYDRVTGETSLVAAALPNTDPVSFADLAISADGRYLAFTSDAPLLPGQHFDGDRQVFLYDRVDRSIRLVSHASVSATTAGDGNAFEPSISSDGQYVLFISSSSDLVPGQGPFWNAFLYDRTSGALAVIGPAVKAVISADGRYVAIDSASGAHLYDRVAREDVLLGASTGLSLADPELRSLAISDDGRYVAFTSGDDHRVPGQQGGTYRGLFLYDRVSRTHTLVSRQNGSPTTPASDNGTPAISGDGRFVAFSSPGQNLATGQAEANSLRDVFLFDRTSGTTMLVSHASASSFTTGHDASYAPAISANGSRILFSSLADDLVADFADRNQSEDLFLYETASGRTAAVSHRAPEMPSLSAAAPSGAQAVSADGRFVAFGSGSPHLIAGQVDTNGQADVFLFDRATRSTILVSRSANSPTRTASGHSVHPVLSSDGRYIVFFSNATDLVAGASDPGQSYDIFFFDRIPGTVTMIGRTSRTSDPVAGYSLSLSTQISPDGRWVAFSSPAADLVPGQQEQDTEETLDVFLWDRLTRSTLLVSRSTAGPTVAGNRDSLLPALSADGRFVAFVSTATDLVPGQIDDSRDPDLFLYDRTTGGTTLVSHAASSALTAASVTDERFSMSADGRFLTFINLGEDLDPTPPLRGGGGVYLYDRTLGTNHWIVDPGFSRTTRISADGRSVIFLSGQTLLPDFPSTSTFNDQVYLYDRISKALLLVSRPAFATGRTSDGKAQDPAISADGRYVTFLSDATNLVAGQTAAPGRNFTDVFLFDRASGTTTLVSRSATSPVTAVGHSSAPLLSASGRQVAFTSALDLVDVDFNLLSDAYVFSLDPPPPTPLPTCKLFDTRRRADRPVLSSNVQRTVTVRGTCGVPATAKQVVVNVTVVNPSGKGNLRFYPGAVTATPSGILRFERNATRTETFTLPLSTNGTLTILPLVTSKGTVHGVVEVTGYAN